MKGSEIGSAAFREPPSGGPRKAQPEVCLESRSPQQSVGLRGKSLIFRLKVTRVRQPRRCILPLGDRQLSRLVMAASFLSPSRSFTSDGAIGAKHGRGPIGADTHRPIVTSRPYQVPR